MQFSLLPGAENSSPSLRKTQQPLFEHIQQWTLTTWPFSCLQRKIPEQARYSRLPGRSTWYRITPRIRKLSWHREYTAFIRHLQYIAQDAKNTEADKTTHSLHEKKEKGFIGVQWRNHIYIWPGVIAILILQQTHVPPVILDLSPRCYSSQVRLG